MKFLCLWFLIILGVSPHVVCNNTSIFGNINNEDQWEKVASYMQKVLLNDDTMQKGFVNLLIVDFTVNHDIDELVKSLNGNSKIIVNIIKDPIEIKLKFPDFVIIIQDFMQLDVKKTHFVDDFLHKLDQLFVKKFMDLSAKYYIVNSVNTKLWTFPKALQFIGKCSNLFRTQELDNLMFIDRYDSDQFAIVKPYLKNNTIFFRRHSPSKAIFPVSKMGEMDENIIKLLQFDEPPFSKVENGKLLGTEGRLLDTLCERYNTTYTIVNENSTNLHLKDFHLLMYDKSIDLSLNYILRVNENKFFGNIILNELQERSLVVPRNIPLSAYDSFSYPFDDKISICLFCASCMVVVAWKAVSFAVKSDFNIDFIAFSVFRYLMGNSATSEHRMSYKEKFIVYGYVWASFVLLTLYESYVISFMMTDQSYRSVATLKELNDSDTKIYEYFMDGIQFKEDLIVHKMFLNVDNVILKMPDEIDVNMAYLVNNIYADAFLSSTRNYDKDGRRLFDKLKENIMSYVPTYTVKKSFPLKNELKFMVDALRESGIKNHWIEEMFNKKQENIDPVLAKNVVEVVEKIILTLTDMKVPFVILGMGLTLSFVIFIIEHIVNKINRP